MRAGRGRRGGEARRALPERRSRPVCLAAWPLNLKEHVLSETRKYRKFTAQQKTEIVLASLRGTKSMADLCREHDIADSLLRKWRE
jgi:hypothetical protein